MIFSNAFRELAKRSLQDALMGLPDEAKAAKALDDPLDVVTAEAWLRETIFSRVKATFMEEDLDNSASFEERLYALASDLDMLHTHIASLRLEGVAFQAFSEQHMSLIILLKAAEGKSWSVSEAEVRGARELLLDDRKQVSALIFHEILEETPFGCEVVAQVRTMLQKTEKDVLGEERIASANLAILQEVPKVKTIMLEAGDSASDAITTIQGLTHCKYLTTDDCDNSQLVETMEYSLVAIQEAISYMSPARQDANSTQFYQWLNGMQCLLAITDQFLMMACSMSFGDALEAMLGEDAPADSQRELDALVGLAEATSANNGSSGFNRFLRMLTNFFTNGAWHGFAKPEEFIEVASFQGNLELQDAARSFVTPAVSCAKASLSLGSTQPPAILEDHVARMRQGTVSESLLEKAFVLRTASKSLRDRLATMWAKEDAINSNFVLFNDEAFEVKSDTDIIKYKSAIDIFPKLLRLPASERILQSLEAMPEHILLQFWRHLDMDLIRIVAAQLSSEQETDVAPMLNSLVDMASKRCGDIMKEATPVFSSSSKTTFLKSHQLFQPVEQFFGSYFGQDGTIEPTTMVASRRVGMFRSSSVSDDDAEDVMEWPLGVVFDAAALYLKASFVAKGLLFLSTISQTSATHSRSMIDHDDVSASSLVKTTAEKIIDALADVMQTIDSVVNNSTRANLQLQVSLHDLKKRCVRVVESVPKLGYHIAKSSLVALHNFAKHLKGHVAPQWKHIDFGGKPLNKLASSISRNILKHDSRERLPQKTFRIYQASHVIADTSHIFRCALEKMTDGTINDLRSKTARIVEELSETVCVTQGCAVLLEMKGVEKAAKAKLLTDKESFRVPESLMKLLKEEAKLAPEAVTSKVATSAPAPAVARKLTGKQRVR